MIKYAKYGKIKHAICKYKWNDCILKGDLTNLKFNLSAIVYHSLHKAMSPGIVELFIRPVEMSINGN